MTRKRLFVDCSGVAGDGVQPQSAVAIPVLVLPVEANRVLRVTRRADTTGLEPGSYYVLSSIAPSSPSVALFFRVAFSLVEC